MRLIVRPNDKDADIAERRGSKVLKEETACVGRECHFIDRRHPHLEEAFQQQQPSPLHTDQEGPGQRLRLVGRGPEQQRIP